MQCLQLGPEYARATGIRALEPLGIFLPGDASHPGGWLFDPLGLARQAERFEDLKVRVRGGGSGAREEGWNRESGGVSGEVRSPRRQKR